MQEIKPETFGSKIKQLREAHGYSLRQVSQQSKTKDSPEISASYWSLIERGKRNIPKPDTIKRMARGLRIPENDLLEMAGYIVQSPVPPNAIPFDAEQLISYPVVGTIKCGVDGLALFDFQGKESTNIQDVDASYDYFWLVTSGDSMIGDGIINGDFALIKKTQQFNNGDICAIIVDGEEGTLKHITKNENSIVLAGSNPTYPPRIFVGADMNKIYVAGTLVETKRKY